MQAKICDVRANVWNEPKQFENVGHIHSPLVFRQNQLLLRSEFGVVAQGWNMQGIYIYIYI